MTIVVNDNVATQFLNHVRKFSTYFHINSTVADGHTNNYVQATFFQITVGSAENDPHPVVLHNIIHLAAQWQEKECMAGLMVT